MDQEQSDGSIRCKTIGLLIDDVPTLLCRPLNARAKWPLYAILMNDDEIRVFDLNGELSSEFWIAITETSGGSPQ